MNYRPSPGPDFVMLGVPSDDGVWVYASTELTQAALESEVEQRSHWDMRDPVYGPRVRYTLTAEFKSYTMARGATYAEAFRTLFEAWRPDEQHGHQQTLPPSVTALGSPYGELEAR